MATELKPTFSTTYWVNQLIALGKQIQPDKYTEGYCQQLHKQWLGKPLTMLHYKVRVRQELVNEFKNQ